MYLYFSIGEEIPLMHTSMILQIPVATIKPNLDEIQNAFSQVLQSVLDIHKYIGLWAQEEKKSAMKKGKRNYKLFNLY